MLHTIEKAIMIANLGFNPGRKDFENGQKNT